MARRFGHLILSLAVITGIIIVGGAVRAAVSAAAGFVVKRNVRTIELPRRRMTIRIS